MRKYSFCLIAMALVVLSACAQKRPVSSIPPFHRPPEPVPEISRPVPDQGAVPDKAVAPDKTTLPDDSPVAGSSEEENRLLSAVQPVQRPRPQALTRMIGNAENQLNNRQPQLAFSTLEQALYIDGQDPLIWHLMARAQFDQGNIVQAVSLARKSNSLAAAYPEVKEKNAALLRKAQGGTD